MATDWITSFTPDSPRSDSIAWAGLRFQTVSSPQQVTELARWVPGDSGVVHSGTHTVKLVNASDGTDVAGGSVSINLSGATPGAWAWASLASPVVLAGSTEYYLVSTETAGDWWLNSNNQLVVATAEALSTGAVYSTGSGWNPVGVAGNAYVPVNFRYGTAAPPAAQELWGAVFI